MSNISARVKKIIVDNLGVDENKVTENANFVDDLGADSLEVVEIVMSLEEEFDIEIQDDSAKDIQTVGDAINFIKEVSSN